MAKKKINIFIWILTILAVIGNIAWGIFGISRFFNKEFLLVDLIFRLEWISNIIYIIVGLVGLALIPSVIYMIFKKR